MTVQFERDTRFIFTFPYKFIPWLHKDNATVSRRLLAFWRAPFKCQSPITQLVILLKLKFVQGTELNAIRVPRRVLLYYSTVGNALRREPCVFRIIIAIVRRRQKKHSGKHHVAPVLNKIQQQGGKEMENCPAKSLIVSSSVSFPTLHGNRRIIAIDCGICTRFGVN